MKSYSFVFLIFGCSTTALANADSDEWDLDLKATPRARLFSDFTKFDSDVTPLTSANRLGSARLGVSGTITTKTTFLFEVEYRDKYNFGGEAQTRYAVVSHEFSNGIFSSIGQTDEPFGLEAFTSNRYTTFIDRALPFAFVPFYHVGAIIGKASDRGGVAIGKFGKTVGQSNHDDGDGWSGRMFYSPVKSESVIWHIGTGVSRRYPSAHAARYSSRPESSVTNVKFVDTGLIRDVRWAESRNIESVYINNGFSVQSEIFVTEVDRFSGKSDYRFNGGYVYVSYILGQASRKFDNGKGVFKGLKRSVASHNVWEIALRASEISLNDGELEGGRERNYTLGLNWYWSDDIRIMLNHTQVKSEKGALADDPSFWALRLQVGF